MVGRHSVEVQASYTSKCGKSAMGRLHHGDEDEGTKCSTTIIRFLTITHGLICNDIMDT